MEISEELHHVIDLTVTRSLRTAFDARGLLLRPEVSTATAVEIADRGTVLLRHALAHCYGDGRKVDQALHVEFSDAQAASRIGPALTFGWVTAGVLAPRARSEMRSSSPRDLLCALFNLGIGLVDGLCDGAPQLGRPFLETLEAMDVAEAAVVRASDDQLRSVLPTALAEDPTVAFAARVIEAFFDLLHIVYPDPEGAELRSQVGARLEDALAAEVQSVGPVGSPAHQDQLLEVSRLTSVLPFQIIEQLATGDVATIPITAGSLFGEAMWRIDDLVDLVEDAKAGAVNALLLNATPRRSQLSEDADHALEKILNAQVVPVAAAEAAQHLDEGLRAASGSSSMSRRLFMAFIQSYAGIPLSDDPGRGFGP